MPKYFSRLCQTLLLGLILPWQWGCSMFSSSKPSVIEQAPGFTAQSLVQQGAVIGAITSASDLREDHDSSDRALADALGAYLVGLYPQMTVLTAASVEGALGADRYAEWAGHYRDSGKIAADSLSTMLPELLDTVGYLFMGRIEADELSNSEFDHVTYEEDKPPDTTGTTYKVKRKSTMRITIYELRSGVQSWDGVFQVAHSRGHFVGAWETAERGIVEQLLSSALPGPDPEPVYTYPLPDSNEDQTQRIYRKFAKELFGVD